MMKVPSIACVMVFSAASLTYAQEPADAEETQYRNSLALFVGALSNVETDETGPAIGVDYTREVRERLAIVALAEWANAGEREAAFGGGVEVKPGGNVKLVFAPGVILERTDEEDGSSSRETLFVFRTGFGYELEVSGVPLVPTINFDIVDSDDGVELHLVYGLSVEIPF